MNQQQDHHDDEINLIDYWRVIMKRRKCIGLLVLTAVVTASVVSFLMPHYYKSESVIIPVGNGRDGGFAALAGQFGGVASLAGIRGAIQAPSQQLMALLQSRTLAENVIRQHDLAKGLLKAIEEPWDMEDAVKALHGYMSFSEKKDGTIAVSAEVKDRTMAANLANWYLENLQQFINDNAFTVAKRNRIFVEQQLAKNKRELLTAGRDLNEFYQSGRVSSVKSKLDVPLIDGEVKFEKADARLSALEGRKRQVDAALRKATDNEGMIHDVPQQVYLEYLTLRKTLLTQINSLLTQQYEMAKIQEAKDELAFQVIDYARVPKYRSKPERKSIVAMALIASLFAGIVLVISLENIEKMKEQTKSLSRQST